MSSYPRFYWIAGGQPKTGGIDSLADLFGRVEKAYLIGEAAPAFGEVLKGKAPAALSGTIEQATAQAYTDAAASGQEAIVLLSPACASFDQFADFEARGEAFRAAVQRLANTARGAA
jgi:UDP-N-acetylmuramoylalanine--D-glutamate ligase